MEQHEAQGHLPYRRWCPQCGSARGVGQQHRRVAHTEEELPVVHLDFAFYSTGEQEEGDRITTIVMYDSKTRSTGAVALPRKGGDKHVTDSVEFLQLLGHRRLVLKSDVERAILALKIQVRAAGTDVEIIPQESPPGDHKAAGEAENTVKRVKGLARTICLSLHSRLGCRLPHQHPLHYLPLASTDNSKFNSIG
eukprot:2306754-Amphidinium_carterae.1